MVQGLKLKKYNVMKETSLLDTFDTIELDAVKNKEVYNEKQDQPPNLFPAFTTRAPPAAEEPRHKVP